MAIPGVQRRQQEVPPGRGDAGFSPLAQPEPPDPQPTGRVEGVYHQGQDTPRELNPQQPTVGPDVRRAGATPTTPDQPDPVSLGTPSTFSPMPPSMSPGEAALPASNLYGRAGGLLGGGIGVPGILGGTAGPDHAGNPDILNFLRLLGKS